MTIEANPPQTTASADALFQPYPFGRVTLPNRIAMAPMTRGQSPNKVPTDTVVEYYRRRAAGGVGLIITEGVNLLHPASSGYPSVPYFDSDDAKPMWKKVADAVHAEGGFIIPQLWHVGSLRQSGMEPDPSVPGWGPSPVVHPNLADKGGEPPYEMTQQDIDDTIATYASAAAAAEELGFDGLELHCAHSYLVDQFFWEATNLRTDKYGGKTLPERTRFAVEIIQAVRGAISADFPVVLRYSQWKQGDYKHKMAATPQELEAFLAPLVEAGVDYFHASTRRFNDPEFEESNLNLAGWTQKITGKPSISVGSVGLDSDFLRSYAGKPAHKIGVDALVRRLEAGEFDLVAVGRALLADPEWANKVREGREADIVEFDPGHMSVFP
jgi:2,4-dienoyl-CoA reductase-like NADH-dependent reductase (Old Yellow Enzyme family)